MSEANVSIGNIANAVWYTDKAEIVTGADPASYNVFRVNVAQPVTLGGFVVNGSAALTTTYTGANIIGCSITGTGIAANTTISSQTISQSVTTSFTLSNNATANNGNAASFSQFTVNFPAPGNIYSAAPQVAATSSKQIYVGVGNYLTVTSTGGDTTTQELGTASSATAAG